MLKLLKRSQTLKEERLSLKLVNILNTDTYRKTYKTGLGEKKKYAAVTDSLSCSGRMMIFTCNKTCFLKSL